MLPRLTPAEIEVRERILANELVCPADELICMRLGVPRKSLIHEGLQTADANPMTFEEIASVLANKGRKQRTREGIRRAYYRQLSQLA